jgi:hypothetical protein
MPSKNRTQALGEKITAAERKAAAAAAAREARSRSDRLRSVFKHYCECERKNGRNASQSTFAAALEVAPSTVSLQLSGSSPVTSEVAIRCRSEWDISPTWLLCGYGPMFCVQVVEAGSLEAMLDARLRAAIARASTPELPLDHGRSDLESQELVVGRDVGGRENYELDIEAALAHLEQYVVEGAQELARARDAFQLPFLKSQALLLRDIGGDPMKVFELPSVKRALAMPLPFPDHPVVKGR